jgi:hypothetical protein
VRTANGKCFSSQTAACRLLKGCRACGTQSISSLLHIVLPNDTLPNDDTHSRKRARAACIETEGSRSEDKTTSEAGGPRQATCGDASVQTVSERADGDTCWEWRGDTSRPSSALVLVSQICAREDVTSGGTDDGTWQGARPTCVCTA